MIYTVIPEDINCTSFEFRPGFFKNEHRATFFEVPNELTEEVKQLIVDSILNGKLLRDSLASRLTGKEYKKQL